ncbi:MAG: PEP-CTERM sorting domain-containing protein [Phycisphaerae bacterium]|jgi:hypothetical protein|nr:PEP-CTERM sorting domain-containing protein [Phycisphaerae bacterium]
MRQISKKSSLLAAATVMVIAAQAAVAIPIGFEETDILPGWVHLGDQTLSEHAPYGGAAATGVNWQTTFTLPQNPTFATLNLGYCGSDYNNPILINGSFLAYLPIHPGFPPDNGSLNVPLAMLNAGTNTIRIYPELRGNNYDDISFGQITMTTPEPATLSLLALGGLVALRRRRK